MRGKLVFVQQLQDVVDDRILGFGEEVRLREGGFRNAGAGILAAELGDDVIEVLLGAEALALEHFHYGGNPHMLETVGSSRDMLSRVGRLSLIA